MAPAVPKLAAVPLGEEDRALVLSHEPAVVARAGEIRINVARLTPVILRVLLAPRAVPHLRQVARPLGTSRQPAFDRRHGGTMALVLHVSARLRGRVEPASGLSCCQHVRPNQRAKVEGRGVQLIVPPAAAAAGNEVALLVDGCRDVVGQSVALLSARLFLRRLRRLPIRNVLLHRLRSIDDQVEQPLWGRGERPEVEVVGETVGPAVSEAARSHDEVATGAADVDPGAFERALFVPEVDPLRHAEDEVPPAARRLMSVGRRDAAMLGDKGVPRGEAVRVARLFRHVRVDRQQAQVAPHSTADESRRPLRPPGPDLLRVGGSLGDTTRVRDGIAIRILVAGDVGPLHGVAGRPARHHGETTSRIVEGVLERGQ